MNLKNKVLTGLKWTVGVKFGTQLINWAFTIIVMRLLHPDDYGLIAMAMVFTALCLLLNEMGLGAAIVQAKEIPDRMLKQTFGLVILLNTALCLILFVLAPLIADLYNEPRLINIVKVLALQFPILAFFVIPNSLLTRDMNFKPISIIRIVAELSSGVCTLVMAWNGYGVWSLIMGNLIRVVIQSVGINIAKPFIKIPLFNMKGFGEAAKFGGFISLQRILWYLYAHADAFIIGKILGKTNLGFYSVAMHIASLPMQKIGSIMSQVGLPAYSKIQDNRDAFANYALKITRAIALISMPLFFGISSIASVLIPVVLGDKWLPAILPLQLLSLVVPLRILSVSLSPAIIGIGRPDLNVKILSVACVVMPLSFFIGTQWGLYGVSLAWIIGYSSWFIYMLKTVLHVIGLTMKKFFSVLIYPIIFSSIMYAAVFITRFSLEKIELNQILLLVILIVTGMIVYTGGMLLFRRDTCFDVLNMFRNK